MGDVMQKLRQRSQKRKKLLAQTVSDFPQKKVPTSANNIVQNNKKFV